MTPKQERIVVEVVAWICVIILIATVIFAISLW
jgi:hypothetical protein